MCFGINVIHYDGIIDWEHVKNDPNQVDFMVDCTLWWKKRGN